MSAPNTPRRRRIAGERRRPELETQPPGTQTPRGLPEQPRPSKPLKPPKPSRASSSGSLRLFVLALVLAVGLLTTALWLGLRTWDYSDVRAQERVEDVQGDAAATAERAAAAVLSFEHTSLDADLKAAQSFLSDTPRDEEPSFRDTFTETFNTDARPLAEQTKATVTAKVLASAVVNASETRAEILVYVDQTTVSTASGGRPQVALNRVSFDMVREGGSWLVADITAY